MSVAAAITFFAEASCMENTQLRFVDRVSDTQLSLTMCELAVFVATLTLLKLAADGSLHEVGPRPKLLWGVCEAASIIVAEATAV
jgi:hypothetical protein